MEKVENFLLQVEHFQIYTGKVSDMYTLVDTLTDLF